MKKLFSLFLLSLFLLSIIPLTVSATSITVSEDYIDDFVLGNLNAPVTIVEYLDFQCPFCSQFAFSTFPQIKKDYIDEGKVQFVFKDYPLSFHEQAHKAARVVNCAGRKGKYLEAHDFLFKNQAQLREESSGDALYIKLANELGIDIAFLDQCMSEQTVYDEVEKDITQGTNDGVTGTPNFFVLVSKSSKNFEDIYKIIPVVYRQNIIVTERDGFIGVQISGSLPYEAFKQILEGMLKDLPPFQYPDEEKILPPQSQKERIPLGCTYDDREVPYGFVLNNKFCDFVSKQMVNQHDVGQTCSNNFECRSGTCSTNLCVDLAAELEETQGILTKIWNFLTKLF